MKKIGLKWFCIAGAAAVVISLFSYFANPQGRVERFVSSHGTDLEQRILSGDGIPADLGIKTFNDWDGDHPMTEFILFTQGSTYYGCYYSPDDIPLSFQNVDVPLSESNRVWTWTGEGDNHGTTTKIADRWYYFEASF